MPLPNDWREKGNVVARLIAQAWMDDGFKSQFMGNPVPELEQAGVEIPKGVFVKVVEGLDAPWKIVASEDAQTATYIINIPAKPDGISDGDLKSAVADRAARICSHCFCCV